MDTLPRTSLAAAYPPDRGMRCSKALLLRRDRDAWQGGVGAHGGIELLCTA